MEKTNKIIFKTFEEAYKLYADILAERQRGKAPFIKQGMEYKAGHGSVCWEIYYQWE